MLNLYKVRGDVMNIGFDVDGVFTDLQKFQLEYGQKFFKIKYGMDIVDANGSSIKQIFNCTKEQEYDFWKNNIVYYALKWPMRPGFSEVINKLQEDGNNIFIITSRIKTADNDVVSVFMRHLLKAWFKKNNVHIPDSNFKFCSIENAAMEKSKHCVENKIDIMVEDDLSNIREIKKVTNVIGFKNAYNKDAEDVTLVDSIYEFYDIFCKKYQRNKFRFLKCKERAQLSSEQLIKYYEAFRKDYIGRRTKTNIEQTEKNYLKVYSALKKIFDTKYPHSVENEHLNPDEDGVIYVINHRSMLDCPLAMSAIGKKPIHMLLKAEFLDSPAASFLKGLGSVFVQRENVDSEIAASEELTKLVLKGRNILICPEGTRNKTNAQLLPFKTGAVSIAQRTGRPIVPIAIARDNGNITLKFGEKMSVGIFDDIEQKNNELMKKFHKLLDNNEITQSKQH